MDMIHVLQDQRCSGIGTALFNFWEDEMRRRGAKVLMTSSTHYEDEPQAWHTRNGFEPSGELTFGQHEPVAERFFIKNL